MSFYATVQGTITYQEHKDFLATIQILTELDYIKNGKFIDDYEHYISEGDELDHDNNLSITIPMYLYKNLPRILNDITQNTQGTIVWSSTDGCFEGGVIINGDEAYYDLEQWAKDHLRESPPVVHDDQDYEAYVEWAGNVEQEFHASNL